MNRNLKRIGLCLCLIAAAVAGSGCAIGFVETPATNVTQTSATLNGSVGSDRDEQGVYWFEYGPSTAYGSSTAHRTVALTANSKRPVSESINGLTGGTEYHYRLCARDTDPDTRPLCSKDATFSTTGMRPDRPRYPLHLDARDGTAGDPQSGIASVSIAVDGVQVVDEQADCDASQNCALSHDWALEADDYAPGNHTVAVRATDQVGRVTTRNLQLEIQRDTTQPGLSVAGPLKSAPAGWVEQRPYSVTGTAQDAGYGVTSLKLLVDGQQVGQAATQPCLDGGCSLSHTFTADMADYGGGSHTAKIVATDGAGNETTTSWKVNVNPEGWISVAEAQRTLEALDETSPVNTVGPTEEDPRYEGTMTGLGLEQSGAMIQATGTTVPTELSTSVGAGITLTTPDGALFTDGDYESSSSIPIEIDPVGVAPDATGLSVSDGAAAVAADTDSNVDTVVRPIFDGVMTFEVLRDESAPESFSWRVAMDADQTLRRIDDKTAAVYYSDGTAALRIVAEPAHDATGATVPTSLSVAGNVINLTVQHRGAGFVYPVVAGPGWQAAYVATVLPPTGSPDPASVEAVSAPVPDTDPAPEWLRHLEGYVPDPIHKRKFSFVACKPYNHDIFWGCPGLRTMEWKTAIHGWVAYRYHGWAWLKNGWECNGTGLADRSEMYCEVMGPEGYTSRARWPGWIRITGIWRFKPFHCIKDRGYLRAGPNGTDRHFDYWRESGECSWTKH